jgi:hypothetical protein
MIDDLSEAAVGRAGMRQPVVEKLSQLAPEVPLAQADVGTDDCP